MRTTKCDRCGNEDAGNGEAGFCILRVCIGYDKFADKILIYDICTKCRSKLEIQDYFKVISEFIKEMPEEKG